MRLLYKVLFILLVCSCNSTPKEINNPIQQQCLVDSTKRIHWGKGYYKLYVFYTVKVNDNKFPSYFIHKLETSTSAAYHKGDSIIIKYNKLDPSESTIIAKKVKLNQNK